MICCVRSAIRAACSVGSASVSSREFVWSDCVPPSTPANAWIATRTMLLYGCCAVSEHPAVCVWNRRMAERGFLHWNRSVITLYQRSEEHTSELQSREL